MKLGEILELTLTSNVPAIAKEIEGVNEKSLRALLKELGCKANVGVKGWTYQGNEPEILEKSIYDFIQPREKRNASTHKSITKADTSTNESTVKVATSNAKASTSKSESNSNSNSTPDKLDMLFNSEDKESKKRTYRGFYFDNDVLSVIDNIKNGNKSDLINEALRTVFKNKGWID